MSRLTDIYHGPGKTLTLVAPYDVTGGEGAKVGAIFGVACGDTLETVEGPFMTEGEFFLEKTSAQAWVVGDRIYWNDSTKKCDTDSAAGMYVGVATAIAANPSANGYVKLAGSTSELSEGAQAAIVILTDSTGGSGTHDDTIADGLTATAPAAITNYAAVVNMTNPVTKTEGEAVSAALAVLENEVTALQVTVAACVTDLGVQNQNDSDLAQKVIEIRAALVAAGIIDA